MRLDFDVQKFSFQHTFWKLNFTRNFHAHFLLPEIESKYERKMRMLRDELELRRKTEIHEVEERKNSQINTLMKNHEKAFSDIKNYYNDITLNNLALINSLKVSKCRFFRSFPITLELFF